MTSELFGLIAVVSVIIIGFIAYSKFRESKIMESTKIQHLPSIPLVTAPHQTEISKNSADAQPISYALVDLDHGSG
jgi:hypothetical protein